MKIQDFTGGLATRVRPQYINVNEGVKYSNIDSQVGSLAPVKGKLAIDTVIGRYHKYYDAKQQWVSKTVPTDFVEFQKKMYYTDRLTAPKKFDGVTEANLGIQTPPKLTDFTLAEHPESPDDITIDIDSAVPAIPKENTYYVLVNVDDGKQSAALSLLVDTTGRISILAAASTSITAPTLAKVDPGTAKRQMTIKNPKGIVIGDEGVKIFRLYEGKYRFIGTLVSDTDAFIDNVYDISANAELDQDIFGELEGTLQYALTYYNSSDGAESATSTPSNDQDMGTGGTVTLNNLPVSTDPQVDKKRLYRIGNNITAYTLVAELDNATTTYQDLLRDTELIGTLAETQDGGAAPLGLSFLTSAYAMLFGAVGNKLVFTPVGQPNNWPPLYFLQYEADITGIAAVANGILVFTAFKTHLVTGTGPSSLSSQLLSSDQGCIAFESVQVISGAAIWASTDGLSSSSGDYVSVISKPKLGKIALTPIDSVVFDEVYYLVNADDSVLAFDFGLGKVFKNFAFGVSTLAVANDELYGWKSNVLYKVMSSGTESFEYLSPRFIEGRATETKTYKKVYIYSKGFIIIEVIIDDFVVCIKELTIENGAVIQVPDDKQRGFFIQFRVTGTGEVYEIEYEAGRRKND